MCFWSCGINQNLINEIDFGTWLPLEVKCSSKTEDKQVMPTEMNAMDLSHNKIYLS